MQRGEAESDRKIESASHRIATITTLSMHHHLRGNAKQRRHEGLVFLTISPSLFFAPSKGQQISRRKSWGQGWDWACRPIGLCRDPPRPVIHFSRVTREAV
jgi:hypothetical protein